MNRIILALCCCILSHAASEGILQKWTKYRVTEMFELNKSSQDLGLSDYFSEAAWYEYQTAIEESNISALVDDNFSVTLNKFVKPVSITDAPDNKLYAQTTFILRFSSKDSSWEQPVELILTLQDEDGDLRITEFEGITSEAINVRNFSLEHAKECNN